MRMYEPLIIIAIIFSLFVAFSVGYEHGEKQDLFQNTIDKISE